MIVFAVTENGCIELKSRIIGENHPVWLANGILSDQAIASLRSDGLEVTVFSEPATFDDQNAIEDALQTIKEHHPGMEIYVAK
jgi:hypothetical protein